MTPFTEYDPTLENYWRPMMLFERNVAWYNRALGKSVLILAKRENQAAILEQAA